MIGSLRGTVVDRDPSGQVLVEVGGVGYRVQVIPTALAGMEVGREVLVWVHHHIRDDHQALYGFATKDQRSAFEALLGAHGVGPALAMAILSVHRPSNLRQALADDDVDALCLVPGVGKKTAARLLLELKSRLDLPDGDVLSIVGGSDGGGARSEVREALASLGYGPQEISEAIRDLPADGDVQRLLKDALTKLSTVR